MDDISASVGSRLFGLSVFTLMKRMSILLGWRFAVTVILSNSAEANRHESESFFGAHYNWAGNGNSTINLTNIKLTSGDSDFLRAPISSSGPGVRAVSERFQDCRHMGHGLKFAAAMGHAGLMMTDCTFLPSGTTAQGNCINSV
jgi:hypothetical protein